MASFKIPHAVPRLKAAPRAVSGQVNGHVAIGRKDEPPTHERSLAKPVVFEDPHPDWTAFSGVSVGLTVPGPEKSYMSARIEASCYLPHPPTKDAVKKAFTMASELVSDQLEEMSKDIEEYFKDAKPR